MAESAIRSVAAGMSHCRAGLARLVRAGVQSGKDALARLSLLRRRLVSVSEEDRLRPGLRILMVDDLVPDPLLGAGYPRAFAIVQSLVRAGHSLTFYPMESTPADLARMNKTFGSDVAFRPGEGMRGLRRLLWREGARFDVLFVSRSGPMHAFVETKWTSPSRRGQPHIIYDAEAVLSPREARRCALLGQPWSDETYREALDTELGFARGVDAVTAVSRADAAMIASVLEAPVFVLPHPVSVEGSGPPFTDRRDFLFVGRLTGPASLSPNVDSVAWFLSEVMPHLDQLMGRDYRLHIAGLFDAPDIESLLSDRVLVHGVVDDLLPLYSSCRVFIAPTRFAAGIPIKVIEAMGQGIPCVATPLLAEQLAVGSAELPTGATPLAFAQQCASLYGDQSVWGDVRDRALEHVTSAYSHASFDQTLREVFGTADEGGFTRPDQSDHTAAIT